MYVSDELLILMFLKGILEWWQYYVSSLLLSVLDQELIPYHYSFILLFLFFMLGRPSSMEA